MKVTLYDYELDESHEIGGMIGKIVEMELTQHCYPTNREHVFPMDTECVEYWLKFTRNLRKLFPVMKRASREQLAELIALEEPYLDDPMVAQQVEMAYFGIE